MDVCTFNPTERRISKLLSTGSKPRLLLMILAAQSDVSVSDDVPGRLSPDFNTLPEPKKPRRRCHEHNFDQLRGQASTRRRFPSISPAIPTRLVSDNSYSTLPVRDAGLLNLNEAYK